MQRCRVHVSCCCMDTSMCRGSVTVLLDGDVVEGEGGVGTVETKFVADVFKLLFRKSFLVLGLRDELQSGCTKGRLFVKPERVV